MLIWTIGRISLTAGCVALNTKLTLRYERAVAFLPPSARQFKNKRDRVPFSVACRRNRGVQLELRPGAPPTLCSFRECSAQDGKDSTNRAIAHAPAASVWG